MALTYRRDIDGLRAVAVLPVVLFHAGLGFSGGFIGVDVFFVISGFLITSILLRENEAGQFSILGFYERRARRILPALFAMLIVVTAAVLVLFIPDDLDAYAKSLAAASLFLSNVWFFSEIGYFTEAAELKPLLHTWSLGIEEQYYLFFPLLLWALFRFLGRVGIFGVLAGLTALSFALSAWGAFRAPDAAFYLPQYRMWELFIGSLLAMAAAWNWLRLFARHLWLVTFLALAGLVAILVPVFTFSDVTRFPGAAALLPVLGAAVLIDTGGLAVTPVSRLLSLRPFVFIGQISYSLYLWHWPILALRFYVTGRAPTVVEGLVCVALSIVIAYLSWRYVEAPFRDRRRFVRPQILGGAAAGIAVAVILGGAIAKLDGLPWRMPADYRALAEQAAVPDDGVDGPGCHFVTPERGRNGDVCVIGDESAVPRFVLVGDSHAGALSPAFAAAAGDLGIAGYQYTNSDFRPLLGVTMRGSQGWSEQPEALLDFLAAHPSVRTLFVTGFWIHQMSGETYRHSGDIWEDEGYDGSGPAYNATATIAGLTRFAERLPAGVRIVLLDDVPSGEALNIKSMLRAVRFGRADLSGLDAREAAAQRAVYEPALDAFADETRNTVYVPLLRDFCGEEHCPLFDGETLLFRDGDHLSTAAVAGLRDKARLLLQKFL